MHSRVSPFTALKYHDFRLLWIGNSISQVGNQMQTVAVAWQLYQLTNSAAALGIAGIFGFLPIVMFALIGGLTADKLNRKYLLISSQLILALFSFILAYTSYFNLVSPPLIYAITFFSAAAFTFSAPARQSIIPSLVPKSAFLNAMSLSVLSRQAGVIVGPAIAGLIISLYGVQSVYFVNFVTFLILILTLTPIKVGASTEAKNVSFSLESVIEGIRFVKNSPIIYSTMLLDFLASLFSTATALLPIFALDILKVGPSGLGLLYAAPSVGSIVAGLLLSSVAHLRNQGKILILGVIIYGLATVGFGFSRWMPLSLLFLTLAGVGDMVGTIIRNTARQILTPDSMRGRMISVNMIFIMGGPKLGEAQSGLLAAFIGAGPTVVLGGTAAVFVTFLVAWAYPKMRNYQGTDIDI